MSGAALTAAAALFCGVLGSDELAQDGLEEFQRGLREAPQSAAAQRYFASAAKCFEQSGIETPGLYLNLGNAEFLAGRLPEAIFAFRRGLELDPNDSTLRANLDYARQKVEYPAGVKIADAWPTLLPRPTRAFCFKTALILYAAACLAGMRWFMVRRVRWLTVSLVLFSLAALTGAGWFLADRQAHWQLDHPLVVVREDKVPLRKGNGPSYAALADWPLLRSGMEARQVLTRGDWLQIEMPGGAIGWVPRQAVLTGS